MLMVKCKYISGTRRAESQVHDLNIQDTNYMIHGQFQLQFDDGFSILELLHVLQIYI